MWTIICWLCVALSWDAPQLQNWANTLPEPEGASEVSEGYHFSREIFLKLAKHAQEKPGVVSIERIGLTTRKQPILAFHIRNPVGETRRKVLVFAGIHALEWISTEVALRFLEESIENPPQGIELTIIPILNPDGRAKAEKDLLAGENRYRRGNEKNVDLNRDFAVHRQPKAIWKALLPRRYATSPGPLSQPESQALDALAARERYHRAVSLHAFGGFFYYPWSGRFARPPHWSEFVELGRSMERAMAKNAYKTRELSRWGFFFRAQGSEIDHLYGRYGTKAFLIEVTRSGLNPFKPKTFKTYFRWYNPPNAEKHRQRVARSIWALVRYRELPSERTWPPESPIVLPPPPPKP
jgi:hypothetical protein